MKILSPAKGKFVIEGKKYETREFKPSFLEPLEILVYFSSVRFDV